MSLPMRAAQSPPAAAVRSCRRRCTRRRRPRGAPSPRARWGSSAPRCCRRRCWHRPRRPRTCCCASCVPLPPPSRFSHATFPPAVSPEPCRRSTFNAHGPPCSTSVTYRVGPSESACAGGSAAVGVAKHTAEHRTAPPAGPKVLTTATRSPIMLFAEAVALEDPEQAEVPMRMLRTAESLRRVHTGGPPLPATTATTACHDCHCLPPLPATTADGRLSCAARRRRQRKATTCTGAGRARCRRASTRTLARRRRPTSPTPRTSPAPMTAAAEMGPSASSSDGGASAAWRMTGRKAAAATEAEVTSMALARVVQQRRRLFWRRRRLRLAGLGRGPCSCSSAPPMGPPGWRSGRRAPLRLFRRPC
jgi:hypothetical protein